MWLEYSKMCVRQRTNSLHPRKNKASWWGRGGGINAFRWIVFQTPTMWWNFETYCEHFACFALQDIRREYLQAAHYKIKKKTLSYKFHQTETNLPIFFHFSPRCSIFRLQSLDQQLRACKWWPNLPNPATYSFSHHGFSLPPWIQIWEDIELALTHFSLKHAWFRARLIRSIEMLGDKL